MVKKLGDNYHIEINLKYLKKSFEKIQGGST